jgi:hypothetical protein
VTTESGEAPRATDDALAPPPATEEDDLPDTATSGEDTSLRPQVVSLNPIDGWMGLGFR